jgi:uncharacterized protein GlcG (DUF336 family)
MEGKELERVVRRIIEEAEKLIPVYMENEEDRRIANGNVSVCVIDDAGVVYGKMFGSNKIRGRESFRVAWTKASQVYITRLSTGQFEKLAFNNEIDENKFGIERPDWIGWEGGQLITITDGTELAVGFSGFRGVIDLEIIVRALETVSKSG